MNIKSEENTYLFCQLLNDNKSDKGTALFVKHLYQTGKFKYLSKLFSEQIITNVNNNAKLPYLIASENLLEKLADRFDSFLLSIKQNENGEIFGDVRDNANFLVRTVSTFKNSIIDLDKNFILEDLFNAIGKFVKQASDLMQHLKSQNSGIATNIESFVDLLEKIRTIRFEYFFGPYFMYRGK